MSEGIEARKSQDLLLAILRSALNDTELDGSVKTQLSSDQLKSVCYLAKKHDIAHIVSAVLYKNGVQTDSELQARLQKEELLSVYRYEQMEYAFSQICESLEELGVAYLPLKGAVIRPYYPYASMRTSCDIDILIHESDLDAVVGRLEQSNFRVGERDYHDVSLYCDNNIHLELHFNVQENIEELDAVLKNAWEYAVPINEFRYGFSDAFFAFHQFAHMSYHFVSGGCGIRSLMDLWVMNKKMGIAPKQSESLLKQAGIYKFALEMSKLSEKCFSGGEMDDFCYAVLDYIFRGGVYGSSENEIAVKKVKTDNTFLYAMKRLFPPFKVMAVLYPVLKKAPFLMPFCWIARWFKTLFGGKTKKVMSELSKANNLTAERAEEIRGIYSRLGL